MLKTRSTYPKMTSSLWGPYALLSTRSFHKEEINSSISKLNGPQTMQENMYGWIHQVTLITKVNGTIFLLRSWIIGRMTNNRFCWMQPRCLGQKTAHPDPTSSSLGSFKHQKGELLPKIPTPTTRSWLQHALAHTSKAAYSSTYPMEASSSLSMMNTTNSYLPTGKHTRKRRTPRSPPCRHHPQKG